MEPAAARLANGAEGAEGAEGPARSARPAPASAAGEGRAPAGSKRKKPRVGRSDVKHKDKPTPGRCHFFMAKKNRYCSMRPAEGKVFCGVHESEGAVAAGQAPPATARQRVPCPIDPSHTVFADQVKHHIKVCTGAKQQAAHLQQPYFSAGLNSGSGQPATPAASGASASALTREDAPAFYEQIEALYMAHVGSLRAVHLKAEECDGLMKAASAKGAEHASYRHLVQQASILGNMERVGILQPKSSSTGDDSGGGGSGGGGDSSQPVFVEFGAGRGMLSLAIREAVPSAPLLLVERGSVRNKADNQLRKQEKATAGAAFERLRVDIRDLDLCRAPMMAPATAPADEGADSASGGGGGGVGTSSARCVAISKHLCGVATDLTLRCLLNAARPPVGTAAAAAAPAQASAAAEEPVCKPCNEQAPAPGARGLAPGSAAVRVEGIAIALCCHHCMNWDDFVGQQFFEETLGLGRAGFDAIKGAVSWCTEACGPKGGLSAEQRAVTGRRCKRLLDLGRVDWLRRVALGMEAELVEYCEPSTSLENALLLAWPAAQPTQD
jgi:tRNA:m4X modification enzyme